jgi:hypothetical protein
MTECSSESGGGFRFFLLSRSLKLIFAPHVRDE